MYQQTGLFHNATMVKQNKDRGTEGKTGETKNNFSFSLALQPDSILSVK
jgi:hypothetical protein